MSTTNDERLQRTGRPKMEDADRKSEVLKFRVKESLKALVDGAAEKSGRTISEEAERRLHNSFVLEPFHQLIFGHRAAAEFFKHIVYAVERIQAYENPPGAKLGSPDWTTSDLTRAALRAAMEVLVNFHIPPAHAPEATPWTPSEQRHYAATLALMEEYGSEVAKMFTGQSEDAVALMNLSGENEH